jgi:protein-tyrosine phosphatase
MGEKHHHAPPPDHSHPYKVVDHLFISGHPDHARDFLEKGVDAVIDLEGDVDSSIPEKEGQENTTIYVYWPIKDEQEMPDADSVRSLSAFVAQLLDDEKEVLVHCRSGHNRSGMVCARTLIEKGWSADDAIKAVRDGRGDGEALTNETFVSWLQGETSSG